MRFLLILIVLVAGVFAYSVSAQEAEQEELSGKEIRSLVNEYVDPDTSSALRESHLTKLASVDEEELSKPISSALKRSEKRERALELAITLQVPGLFTAARKYIEDEETEDVVIELFVYSGDEKAVKFAYQHMVNKVFDEETSSKRRDVYIQKMDPRYALYVEEEVVEALDDEEFRALALEVAIQLEMPKLFTSVRGLIDSDYEDQIVELLLITQDRGAVDFLIKRWLELDSESRSHELLTAGFKSNYLDVGELSPLKRLAEEKDLDEARSQGLLDILNYQLSLEAESLDSVLKSWDTQVEYIEFYGKSFPVKGYDVLDMERRAGWPSWHGRYNADASAMEKNLVRKNLLLNDSLSNYYFQSFEKGTGEGNFSLTLRLCPKSGKGQSFYVRGLRGSSGKYMKFYGKGWEYDNQVYGNGVGEWSEIRFEFRLNDGTQSSYVTTSHVGKLFIDGVEVDDDISYESPLNSMQFQTEDHAELVISSIDIAPLKN